MRFISGSEGLCFVFVPLNAEQQREITAEDSHLEQAALKGPLPLPLSLSLRLSVPLSLFLFVCLPGQLPSSIHREKWNTLTTGRAAK